MSDLTYEVYAKWCRDRGNAPPSRSWWNKHCVAQPNLQDDYAFDRKVEHREGWADE